ncbi:amino acid ABC transporter [Acetobacter estunensis NRIC 0472]|uniref:Amino acid permease n=1 Tax=Acetobacter estunensis TaxID=104097 RepID=A0A967EJ14_9PROT|nr:amino acid permease [Acetobacter estunensis]NHO54189.1 amino acid permease [Acetobacter estunensis]GBQ21391.1 amino acid ABC transporter [Acetobacter estunensis NRIC 0472]
MSGQTVSSPTTAGGALRSRHVTMIALGGVMGAGFFVGSSGAIATAGPSVILSYAFAGLLVLCVNIMVCLVALRAPGRGSFVAQIGGVLGHRCGFVMGWTYWTIWITTIGIEVMAAATLMAPFVHLPYWVIEALILGVMTALNLASVRGYGEVESWLSGIKILAVLAFLGIGLYALGVGRHITQLPLLEGGFFPHGGIAVLSAVPAAVFSMSGSEIGTIAALETDSPAANIARVARTIAIRLAAFFMTSIGMLLCLVSWKEYAPGNSPFLLVLERLNVPFAQDAMTLVILAAILSTLNSGLFAASRVLNEFALSGYGPKAFHDATNAGGIPRRAVLCVAAASGLVALSAVASPKLVFAFLVSVIGSFIIIDDVLIVMAGMKLAPERRALGWFTLACLMAVPASMALYPATRGELALSAGAILGIVGIGSVMEWMRGRQAVECAPVLHDEGVPLAVPVRSVSRQR